VTLELSVHEAERLYTSAAAYEARVQRMLPGDAAGELAKVALAVLADAISRVNVGDPRPVASAHGVTIGDWVDFHWPDCDDRLVEGFVLQWASWGTDGLPDSADVRGVDGLTYGVMLDEMSRCANQGPRPLQRDLFSPVSDEEEETGHA
jgi:hypothetical protein